MIAIAMQCPCGANATIDRTDALIHEADWICLCPDCYDGESGSTAGYGAHPEEAVSDWWQQVEEDQEVCWDLTPAGLNLTVVVKVWAQAEAEAEAARASIPIIDLFEALKKTLEARP
jgi:hypothetical protein